MKINDMTVADFRAVPMRKWNEVTICDGFVLLPVPLEDGLHDSGYRFIELVACNGDKPLCRISRGDALHIGGIGGPRFSKSDADAEWIIDSLPKSGLFRVFTRGRNIKIGPARSSIAILAVKETADG